MAEREKRSSKVKSITRIYYSNPKVQEAIFTFSKDREVVPSYMMEQFGKRPDALIYPADITSLVNKGATSFHTSEELWNDPLQINSDMSPKDIDELRKSWDLLIDIDSPFFDYSKIAARLIIDEIERHGVKNYGIKFSGSKGFHIIIPAKAFPETYKSQETKKMFPEWPRAISEYIMYKIRSVYNKEVTKQDINFKALQERTKLTKQDITEILCPNCGNQSKKGKIVKYECPECKTTIERKNSNSNRKKLRCIQDNCSGNLNVVNKKDYFFCESCKTSSIDKKHKSDKKVTYTKEAKSQIFSDDFKEEIAGSKIASLDLVLVSPRHLFRAPYSLHEKTALASVVITKDQIETFAPKDANPLKVKVRNFYPEVNSGEATNLLDAAISWKALQDDQEENSQIIKKYKTFDKIDLSNISEDIFPRPIKKLLKGLNEGRKRALFILITFLRSINFSADYINKRVRQWNQLNDPPLKEGYVKSQIDWHLKQKRQILPPNYSNNNFYKDLNLLDASSMPRSKNPISEVMRKARESDSYTK